MAVNPLIVFVWSIIFYALSSYLIDQEGFLFILGVICLGLGFFSSKHLSSITIEIKSISIYLVGLVGLFGSIVMVNKVDVFMQNMFMNHFILGFGLACFILAGCRFFINMR
jgi:hypothetical protein